MERQPLFKQPVVVEKLIVGQFRGGPEVEDVFEVGLHFFENDVRLGVRPGVVLQEHPAEHVQTRIVLVLHIRSADAGHDIGSGV